MAILFDWYENPKTKDKQGEELTLHPRIKLNGSTTTDELRSALSGLKVMFFNFTLVLFRFVSSVTGSVQVSVGTK